MSSVSIHCLPLLVLMAGLLATNHCLPWPQGGAANDRIIFGYDEPLKVFPTTKPEVTPDTKIVFRHDGQVPTTTEFDVSNSTTFFNGTEGFDIKSILPNCVNHGCPLAGYECDTSSQKCREILDI